MEEGLVGAAGLSVAEEEACGAPRAGGHLRLGWWCSFSWVQATVGAGHADGQQVLASPAAFSRSSIDTAAGAGPF